MLEGWTLGAVIGGWFLVAAIILAILLMCHRHRKIKREKDNRQVDATVISDVSEFVTEYMEKEREMRGEMTSHM